MSVTTCDRNHPDIKCGVADETPMSQQKVYLVLSQEERAKGYLKPYRKSYRHARCGQITSMAAEIAETYARNPWFYAGTYCTTCKMHRPLIEFAWHPDGESMDPAQWADGERRRVLKLKEPEGSPSGAA